MSRLISMNKTENNPFHLVTVGNPNVGKSLIFNQLSGAHQKVANFPGTTLTHLDGKYNYSKHYYKITDLPGIYGFVTNKVEERASHEFITSEQPDLILNIVDMRKLERNLYLTLQLLELQMPMLVVLTFKDKALKQGIHVNTTNLANELGVPVIAINSHNTKDIKHLKIKIMETIEQVKIPRPLVSFNGFEIVLSNIVRDFPQPLVLEGNNYFEKFPTRWVILSSLMTGQGSAMIWPAWINNHVASYLDQVKETYSLDLDKNFHLDIIRSYYSYSQKITSASLNVLKPQIKNKFIPAVDRLLLHPIIGILLFGLFMFGAFKLTFDISGPLSDGLEGLMITLGDLAREVIPSQLLASFLADGILGGIGFVLVFIPQIAILFLFIAILEHSGYMSRIVFVLDQYLSKLGITGTSIAPLLLGFGCNVPGVLATRSIKDQNERITIALVNPFMSCSARLPVYVIIAGALFSAYVGLILTIVYFTGILVAIITMFLLRKFVLKGESYDLLMELPDLTFPNWRAVVSHSYRHTRKFIRNAAGYMALGLILVWLLSITGPQGYIGPEALESTEMMKKSFIFFFGKFLSPIFAPLGWDVRLVVALILGFVAKEIVIGSLGILYGLNSSGIALQTMLHQEFSPVSGFAFMLFVLTYTPCIGTYFAMKQEIGKKWTNFSVIMSILVAYFLALMVTIFGDIFFS